MQPDAFQTFLRAVPMPAVAIGTDERIVAMNDGGAVLMGQQALHRNYITMVRQPSILALSLALSQKTQLFCCVFQM